MPVLELPEEDITCLLDFAKFDDDDKSIIINIISSYKKSQPFISVIQEISDQLDIDYEEVENFMTVYISLIRTKWSYKMTNDDLLNDITESIRDLELYDEDIITIITNWIIEILNISNKDALISTLGYQAVSSNNSIYYHSEIFEELRPVFLNEELMGLALYHTIKIHCELPDKRHSDIYLALDSSDIDNLILVLSKAKAKTESLKKHYSQDIINI